MSAVSSNGSSPIPLLDARQGTEAGWRVRLEPVADPLMGQALEAEQILKREPDRFDSPGWSQPTWQRSLLLLGSLNWRWPRYCQAILSQVRGEHGLAPPARRFWDRPLVARR